MLNADESPHMMATVAEMALTASYRHAQRVLAAWLERSHSGARRGIFDARASLVGLDAIERHRLARWLAWLCLASRQRKSTLLTRIRHLDPSLGLATIAALSQLPIHRTAASTHVEVDWSMPTRLGA
ncbi:hypothetical protein [Dyella sp. A6]|uniref:hypothetical protein n=1 Tax=Dyella aluminiiresistens TaxID=3069105 RepID=UPI002E792F9D|nr:hypothetical protein [Dyella sp. A6]